VALAPTMILLLYLGTQGYQQARAVVNAEAMRLVKLASDEQEHLVSRTGQVLAILAQLPEIRGSEPEPCQRILAEVLRVELSYAGAGVADASGAMWCNAKPGAPRFSVAKAAFFERAVRGHQFALGDYEIGPVSGKAVIVLAQPLLDGDLRPQGIVFISLDLSRLSAMMASANLPTDSILHVIDNGGMVLQRYPDPDKWVGRRLADAPIVGQMLSSQRAGLAETEGLDGVRRLLAFMPMHGCPRARRSSSASASRRRRPMPPLTARWCWASPP
jgi:hypothetical protein